MGIYREELKSHNKLGCRINPGSNGTEIARNYARSGKRMEIVTVIGHHPLVCMAAGHLVPLGVNEFEVAGGLLGKNIETVPAVSVDLPVPAYGEIAIEGYIDTKEPSSDGPVAEAMGFYGQARECYVINVTAITMRNDAIYHDLYPAHQEHFMVSILDRQIEAFDRLRNEIPSITAVNYGPDMQPGKTLMYIAIDKHSNSDAKRVGETVLKTERWVTMAVVVDSDVNVYDDREVLWAIATNVRGEKSIFNYPAERKALGLAGFPRAILDATRASPFTIQQRVVPPPEVLSRFNLSRMFHIN
jgi:2,5-furandicarboxylate decarboxylase 1